jgi:hypothetical protein
LLLLLGALGSQPMKRPATRILTNFFHFPLLFPHFHCCTWNDDRCIYRQSYVRFACLHRYLRTVHTPQDTALLSGQKIFAPASAIYTSPLLEHECVLDVFLSNLLMIISIVSSHPPSFASSANVLSFTRIILLTFIDQINLMNWVAQSNSGQP